MAEEGSNTLKRQTVGAMCIAQILGMIGYSGVAALLPDFIEQWSLSHTQAGWLSGIFFVGYATSVLVIVSLTDYVAARSIYLVSMVITALSYGAFAASDTFGAALVFRLLAGVGLAGTYMPGLKALSDKAEGHYRSRVVAWYTVAFTIGIALSFIVMGEIAQGSGWPAAFALSAFCAIAASVVAWWYMPDSEQRTSARVVSFLDLRPVFKNRQAMAYVISYAAVIWASAGARNWTVVFLQDTSIAQSPSAWTGGILVVAALAGVLGVPAGLIGNEMSLRFGLRRTAIWIFMIGGVASALFGLVVSWPFIFVVMLTLIYAFLIQGNISNLTTGTIDAASSDHMGATMAVHSSIGFCGGIVGPIIFGMMLDASSSPTIGWWLGFATCAIACVVGAAALLLLAKGPFDSA